MAERERRQTPPFGGVFVSHARIMTTDDMGRAVRRMAHEVIERNHGLDDLVVVGLQTGGVPIAERLAETLADIEGLHPLVGTLDVALHRDDIGLRPVVPEAVTDLTAALDALCDFGQPRSIQLAVMIDRGHRELPIRPDYVGKNLPTRRDEVVDVHSAGVDLGVMQK